MRRLNHLRSHAGRTRDCLAIVQFLAAISILCLAGCGTTTKRMGTEQLLISNAVDEAINQIDFTPLKDQTVFLDTSYLNTVKGIGFVNADYIISSLRQQLTAAHCRLQEDREEADIVVEPRVGALGTDGHEVTYGIPQTSAISTASAALTSTPLLPPIPEISFGRLDAHSGIAKIIVYAFERESKRPIWQSGIAKAESDSNNTWVLGAGPFQGGSIHEDVKFAGRSLSKSEDATDNPEISPARVDYRTEHVFSDPESKHDSAQAQRDASPPTIRRVGYDDPIPGNVD